MRIKLSELKRIINEEKKKMLFDEEAESEHQKNFRKLLKKYKVSSVNDLNDKDKSKFFNELKKM